MKILQVILASGQGCRVLNNGLPIGAGKGGAVYLVEFNGKEFALKYSPSSSNYFEQEAKQWNEVMSALGGEYQNLACSSVTMSKLFHRPEDIREYEYFDILAFPEDVTKEDLENMRKIVVNEDVIDSTEVEQSMILLLPYIRKDRNANVSEKNKINEKMLELGYNQTDTNESNYLVSNNLVIPIDMGSVVRLQPTLLNVDKQDTKFVKSADQRYEAKKKFQNISLSPDEKVLLFLLPLDLQNEIIKRLEDGVFNFQNYKENFQNQQITNNRVVFELFNIYGLDMECYPKESQILAEHSGLANLKLPNHDKDPKTLFTKQTQMAQKIYDEADTQNQKQQQNQKEKPKPEQNQLQDILDDIRCNKAGQKQKK